MILESSKKAVQKDIQNHLSTPKPLYPLNETAIPSVNYVLVIPNQAPNLLEVTHTFDILSEIN